MRWPFSWPKAWRSAPPREPERKTAAQSVLLFARDMLVAFLVVGILLGVMFAYTQVWPPMVVVESGSMQHSHRESLLGVIDTGDLVLVQAVRTPGEIATYVEGRATGHQTYSNYGDVIVFHRPTDLARAQTPIIHRALVYVLPNASTSGWDVPSLAALAPGSWTALSAAGAPTTSPYNLRSFTLRDVSSWDTGAEVVRDLDVDLDGLPARTAGFLTKGDNVADVDRAWGAVPVSFVVGKARGEIPWFGLLKLTVSPGQSGCCPSGWGDSQAPRNSWDALFMSLVALVVGPFVADYAWSRWKKRRPAGRPADADVLPDAYGLPPPPPDEADGPTDGTRTGSSGPEDGDP